MQHNLRRKLFYQKLRESDECHQILSTCREIRLQVRFAVGVLWGRSIKFLVYKVQDDLCTEAC